MSQKIEQSLLRHSKHDLQKELIEFLLNNTHPNKKRSIRWKILLWRFTTTGAHGLKRSLDICFSLLFLLIFSPLLLLVTIWIKLDSPGPLIYRQVRVGLNGRHFNFYKFRSMYFGADKQLQELNSDYEAKRYKDITLTPLEIIKAPAGTFYNWMKHRGKVGGQNKIPRLSNDRVYLDSILEFIRNK